jgi:tetratricopeptide (TPR) repeat protein/peroxiredoxin
LRALIRSGRSFSGRERNCCFLNIGQPRFANVSSVSGFDFPDDARGAALVDWDLDGDLDVWLSNRSGPMTRFLRNDVPSQHHYIALRLEGRRCNRDAIGARIELDVSWSESGAESPTSSKKFRTLRAGDGYLSQSSRWVHFGLGKSDHIGRVQVRWPGGDVEEFVGLYPDQRFHLVQDSGRAQPWPSSPRAVQLQPQPLQAPRTSDHARVVLSARPPLPELEYEKYDGQRQTIHAGTPLLINLWATWCQPCVNELSELAQHETELRQSGLAVLALAVDRLDSQYQSSQEDAVRLLDQMQFPFLRGAATTLIMEKLDLLLDFVFDLRQPPAVPTSYLIDRQGRLAVIYRGPVDVEQLLKDVASLDISAEERRRASVPLEGRWFTDPHQLNLHLLASTFHEQYPSDEARYLDLEVRQLRSQLANPGLLLNIRRQLQTKQVYTQLQLGLLLFGQHRYRESANRFREVVQQRPEDANARYRLGVALYRSGMKKQALTELTHAVQLKPDLREARDTLGLILLEHDMTTPAESLYAETVQLFSTDAEAHNDYGVVLVQLDKFPEAIASFRKSLELDKGYGSAHFNLGRALALTGQLDEAATQIREAQRIDPKNIETYLEFARILIRAEQYMAAAEQLQKCIELKPDSADTRRHMANLLATLASAYAKTGQLDDAIAHQRRALESAQAVENPDLIREMQERLSAYEAGTIVQPQDAAGEGQQEQ